MKLVDCSTGCEECNGVQPVQALCQRRGGGDWAPSVTIQPMLDAARLPESTAMLLPGSRRITQRIAPLQATRQSLLALWSETGPPRR